MSDLEPRFPTIPAEQDGATLMPQQREPHHDNVEPTIENTQAEPPLVRPPLDGRIVTAFGRAAGGAMHRVRESSPFGPDDPDEGDPKAA